MSFGEKNLFFLFSRRTLGRSFGSSRSVRPFGTLIFPFSLLFAVQKSKDFLPSPFACIAHRQFVTCLLSKSVSLHSISYYATSIARNRVRLSTSSVGTTNDAYRDDKNLSGVHRLRRAGVVHELRHTLLLVV